MPKILLVEDDKPNRDILARRLTREGYTVLTAETGTEALNLAATELPDVVLMDMRLDLDPPGLDGYEVTRQLRANPATQSLSIIAVTGFAMSDDHEKALQAGCNDFHKKPIEFDRLRQQIADLLPEGEAS